jgi:predicted ArsR family transcriptional regulator
VKIGRSSGTVDAAVSDGVALAVSDPGRDRVAASLLTQGPATASMLAERLEISATAVRRHLDSLAAQGLVVATDRPPFGPTPVRGRGRPARTFSLTAEGRSQFPADYDHLAAQALSFLAATGGPESLVGFAEARAETLERQLRERLGSDWSGADDAEGVGRFAEALNEAGFAVTAEPAPTGVQVCQHHCPVAHVAAEFPQLCEAETEAFARLVGRHVQRLATIAHGDGVCTTVVPLPSESMGTTSSELTTTTERTSA